MDGAEEASSQEDSAEVNEANSQEDSADRCNIFETASSLLW